jgi:uncharacterized protein (TIGR03086 family)
MTDGAAAVDALEPVYANVERILRGVPAGGWTAPTPCPSYDVHAVTNHLLATLDVFQAGLVGEPRTMEDLEQDFAGDDPPGAFATLAAASLAAWRQPGALDGALALAFGETPAQVAVFLNLGDSLLHGWDVAVATGQDPALPEAPAELMLGFMQGMLKPEMRREGPDATFGIEVAVPADAPVTDRLVGFSGRDPRWRP